MFDKKAYNKKYYQKNKIKWINWKMDNKDEIKEYLKNNQDKVKKWKRRDRIKNNQHYKIRFKTLKKYGKAKICSKCNSTINVVHHHYTEPYEIDKFIDLCLECHKELYLKLGG